MAVKAAELGLGKDNGEEDDEDKNKAEKQAIAAPGTTYQRGAIADKRYIPNYDSSRFTGGKAKEAQKEQQGGLLPSHESHQ